MTVIERISVRFPGPQGARGPQGADGPVGKSAGIAAFAAAGGGGGTPISAHLPVLYLDDPAYGGALLAKDGTADWSEPFYAMIAVAKPLGARCIVPPGRYGTSVPLDVPGSVVLEGSGFEYSAFGNAANLSRGSTFVALNAMPYGAGTHHIASTSFESAAVLRFIGTAFPPNTNLSSSTPDNTGGGAYNIQVDGMGIANCFQTYGRRANLAFCVAFNPLKHSYVVSGQNGFFFRCIASNKSKASSNGAWIENWDNKFYNCEFRDYGDAAFNIQNAGHGTEITSNHVYSGVSGCTAVRMLATDTGQGQIKITNNVFDNVENHIIIIQANSGAGYQGVTITGNLAYHNGSSNNSGAHSFVYFDMASGASANATVISSNVLSNPSNNYSWNALVQKSAAPGSVRCTVIGNIGTNVNHVYAEFRATAHSENIAVGSNAATTEYSSRDGQVAFNGDGTTTTFQIAHSLGYTPISWTVQSTTPDATGVRYVPASATQLTVTYNTAPPTGVSNVGFTWKAWG